MGKAIKMTPFQIVASFLALYAVLSTAWHTYYKIPFYRYDVILLAGALILWAVSMVGVK